MKHRKLLAACTILALLLGAVGWLAGTTGGLRFILARALPYLPVTLDPAEVEGRLVGPLSTGRIELAATGVRGSLERIELDWVPAALLTRTLHLREVRIVAPRLEIEPPPAAADAPAGDARLALPLAVTLDHLALLDGEIRYDGRTLVNGLQLVLAGRVGGDQLELRKLDLRSTQGDISGHARASMAPGAPWEIDLQWRLTLEQGPVAGHTRVHGSLAELQVAQHLSEPLTSHIEGTISGLPGAPTWRLELSVEPLPARAGPWPEALDGVATRLLIDGRLEDISVAGHVELPGLVSGPVAVDSALGWANGVATVRRLDLSLEDGGRLVGSGQVTPGDEPAAEFVLDGTNLGWPLTGADRTLELPHIALRGSGAADHWRVTLDGRARHEGLPELGVSAELDWAKSVLTVERVELASPGGEILASASGEIDTRDDRIAYRLAAEADIRLPEHPPAHAQLAATGDLQGVDIDSLSAQLLDGTIEGSGRITWHGDESADFSLAFNDLDPSSVAPDWPGRLGGTLEIRGMPAGDDGLELTLSSLAGELRDLPVSGDAALNVSGATLLLRRAALEIGSALLQASGRLDDDSVTVDASLEAPALDALHDAARGNLAATVRIDGARSTPLVAVQATGTRLGWRAMRTRAMQVDASVDLSGAQSSRVAATLESFAAAPGPGTDVRIEADGKPQQHRILVELARTRPERHFRLELEGGLEAEHWTGRLADLAITEDEQQVWALRRAAALSASAAAFALGDACMEGTLGLLCLRATWDRAGPWSGSATLTELDLGPLSQWLGMGLLARGVVTGRVVVAADDDGFHGLDGGLELTAGDIRLTEEDSVPLVAWQGGELRLSGDERQARAALDLVLADADRVDGSLAIGWNAADPPIDGRLEARLGQLQLITELLPDLADLEGRATAQATVSGTLGAPRLHGRFEWLDGKAQVPTLGLRPGDINVVAQLQEGALSFSGSGRSGDGDFEVDGRFDLGRDAVEGQASLRGNDLLLADVPEARITATPDLKLRYSDREIVIAGTVGIPAARISGVGGPTAVTTSPDEVIVGPRARTGDDELVVRSRIRVSVGPDVRVEAAGLRGRVEGSLLAVTEPRTLPWGRGELRVVDGTFSTFGQRLEIETGRLIYTGGPLENPGLEIRAVRKVDEVTAGALVRGTLQQPEISVYSEPPLPRAEALSYLTLGKSLDQLQAGEQNTVNQAANSLAMSGGGLIARDLGRRLGFDDVAVSADDATGGTAVVIGKYLGAGLYVSYGLGLFDTVNTLRLRYQINQRLSVEAASGAEAAADLFYTFERD